MKPDATILGIDIGSVSLSIVEIDVNQNILQNVYTFHHGQIHATLNALLKSLNIDRIGAIATTSSTPLAVNADKRYDNRVALIEACRYYNEDIGSILIIGGERFGLIQFDENGNYLSYKTNTSCAAGTGSFMDQQAKRLHLTNTRELSKIALTNTGPIPQIASRCAVFAKTDLIHAQQEGYSLSQICDGLCQGLVKNIIDTLFTDDIPNGPMLVVGGVSKSDAVIKHLRHMLQADIIVEPEPLGAIGAAFSLQKEAGPLTKHRFASVAELLSHPKKECRYFYPPLTLHYSTYPDFNQSQAYTFETDEYGLDTLPPVEVDIYAPFIKPSCTFYLGFDIGSTSTKAVLITPDQNVIAGFYTRTSGRPADATRKILCAIADISRKNATHIFIKGAGTTGSGRKFIGKIIGADLIIDEITAHARAAIELKPDVDTIIEIGGQDSKFTTLKNKMVTFSIMNTVCAAGTGSFIEEQAQRLDCPLTDYTHRTENQHAPISSDRCTVFMERDINHYLNEGYTQNEVLASVLHSIIENYLTKVAIESAIGNTIAFQGATAKNKALVAAFEQRLQKPIFVSRYCHLTGALGVALSLAEADIQHSCFRGLSLYKRTIPIRSEVCDICNNHCKLTIAEIEKETVAYGFLCGRDYDTKSFISNNRSGFDLLKARRKACAPISSSASVKNITVGLPAALHLFDELPFWQKFFAELGISTITSEPIKTVLNRGKRLAGAEFCAPIAALHGHVDYLLTKADYIFLPFYIEHKPASKAVRRQYCYYTQFAPAVVSLVNRPDVRKRILMPLEKYLYSSFYDKVQLYKTLSPLLNSKTAFFDITTAYQNALDYKAKYTRQLKQIYLNETADTDTFHVVLLGRPYTTLARSMNKAIPDIFAAMGVKTFFQDMVPTSQDGSEAITSLLDEIHWHYASTILATAETVARSEKSYPVLLTSFKCTPDAFVIDYFKNIMDTHKKPYLILQLDEHDSNVGYETRIEAACRAFGNHFTHKKKRQKRHPRHLLLPKRTKRLTDKTLVLPNWDHISLSLVTACLRKEGIDARLLTENTVSIQKSLRHNTGQCIPLNIIAQEFIDYVETHHLSPENSVLWMIDSSLSCNLTLFPYHIQNIFNAYGNGMEKAGIYTGSLSLIDISYKLPVNVYMAYLFGGLIRKAGCKIRPYEINAGETDQVIAKNIAILYRAFLENRSKEAAIKEVVSNFKSIAQIPQEQRSPRPKVAIFGDVYVVQNEVINQDIVHFIEAHGGEVIVTPYSSHLKMVAKPYIRKWFREGLYFYVLSSQAIISMASRIEKVYYNYFKEIIDESEPSYTDSPEKILSDYNVKAENTGEVIENLLKIHYARKHHPDISLFVQLSPAFCCPSLVTEAMTQEIERKTGVPVVSITYDGTGGLKNEAIIPYLKYPRHATRQTDYKTQVK